MNKLLPCPFCGGGETRIDERKFWTGMTNQTISVRVRHWCIQEEGRPGSLIEIARKTEAEAIAAWNRPAAQARIAELDAIVERRGELLRDILETFDGYSPAAELPEAWLQRITAELSGPKKEGE